MRERSFGLLAVFTLTLVFVTGPATADSGDLQLRIRGAWVSPDFSYQEVDDDGTEALAKAGSGFGYGLGLEYLITDRVGIELAALRSNPDVDLTVTAPWGESLQASSGLRSLMLSAGVNLHLTPNAPVDFYVGAMVAWIDYGGLDFAVQNESVGFLVDDDTGWAATAGVDFPMGDGGWSLNASIIYVDTSIDATNIDEPQVTPPISYDTLMGTVGVGYRF